MQILIKIIFSLSIIVGATMMAKKLPATAGLIGVMPLTGALTLVWVYLENKDNPNVLQEFSLGALFGLLPTLLFFLTAFVCFKKHLTLPMVLAASFGAWLAAAAIHQWLLK